MKTIEFEYENEAVVKKQYLINPIDDGKIHIITNWSCPVCDGDEETGCLMSDPQNCPYG